MIRRPGWMFEGAEDALVALLKGPVARAKG